MSNKFYNVVTKKTKKEDTLIEKVSLNKIIERTNKIKNTEKGITVLQLVVTIIVILIIAGVIISFITGKNGVIARADDSKAAWTRASELEQLKLAYSACETDYESLGTPIISEKVGTELKKINPDTKVEDFDMVNENLHDYEITIDRKDETGYAKVTFTQTQHIYIVAVVEVNEITAKYNVTYDANRGEGAPAKQVKIHGKPLTLSNIQPKRLGYTFKGWAKSSSAIYSEYTGGQTYNLDADLSLYAVWTLDEYTITYDLDGGQNSSKNPSGYDIDTPTFYLAEPTKENCIFTGWTGSEITSTTKTVAIRKGTTGNKEYKANWELAYYSVDNVAYTKTLNEAINLTKSGSKIKVLRNSNEVENINNINGDITLDLAGKTITTASTINISKDSKLTIIDSGNNNEYIGKIKNTVGNTINNDGTLQIGENDGNILNSPYIESSNIGIENTNGNLLFYDGEITAKTAINGDSVTTPSTYYAMSNANIEAEDETVTLQTLGTAVCRIGYKYYSTLQKAIDETASGTYKEESKEISFDNTIKNNGNYYFEKDNTGKIKSNNKGIQNSVADSYIILDLSSISDKNNVEIKVNANISSESGCDIGYSTITDSISTPAYNNKTGQFIIISGTVSDKDYTTKISGGKIYYLHFGYRKDNSVDSGNDTFTINNISINGQDIKEAKINITTQIPVIPENESTITLLNNVTITGSNTTINELKNLNIELGDYILSSSGTNAHIINNGKLKINSKTGKGTLLSSEYEVVENNTVNDLETENIILNQKSTSDFDGIIMNTKGNTKINKSQIISVGNILKSNSGNIEVSNSNITSMAPSTYRNNANAFKCFNSKIVISNDKIDTGITFWGNSTYQIYKCDIDYTNTALGYYNGDEYINIESPVNIEESTLTACTLYIHNGAEVKLNEDVFNVRCRGIINNGGTCKIEKINMQHIMQSEMKKNQTLISNYGKLIIGINDEKIENNNIIIKSDTEYAIESTKEFEFYDGVISAKGNILDGNITEYDKNYSIVENKDDKKIYNKLYLDTIGVCEVNGKTYKTIEDAESSISDNLNEMTTIKMLNSTYINTNFNLENKKIIIDFNGFEINANMKIIINSNTILTLDDTSIEKNGKLNFNETANMAFGDEYRIENNGELNINNIKIYSVGKIIINNNNILNMNNNKITSEYNCKAMISNKGNINCNNSNFDYIPCKDEYYTNNNQLNIGIDNVGNGYIKIDGGEYKNQNVLVNENSGLIEIKNSKLCSISGKYCLSNTNKGTINIENAEINWNYYYKNINSKLIGIYNINGNINIYKGTKINNIPNGIYNKIGNVNIFEIEANTFQNTIENEEGGNVTIGENNNKKDENLISISSMNQTAINNNGNLYIYDGIFKGKVNSIFGNINEIAKDYNLNLETTKENYKISRLEQIYKYEYNEIKYFELQDAINAISENSSLDNEIKLLSGNLETKEVNIQNRNITLDINGNNFQFIKNITISENSIFNLTDSKYQNDNLYNISAILPSNIGLSGTKGINNYGKLNISNIIIKTIIKDSINIYNEESGNVNIENAKIINSDRYSYGFYSNLNENEYNFIYNLGIVKISDNTNIIIDTDLCYRKMNLYFLKNSKNGISTCDSKNVVTFASESNDDIKILNESGQIIINNMANNPEITEISGSRLSPTIENENGKVEINNGVYSSPIINKGSGTLILNNIETDANIENEKNGDININGGIINGGIINELDGKIYIDSCDINCKSSIYINEAYYYIAIYNNIGTVTIGKKDGIINEKPRIEGKENAIKNVAGKINYYDGILIGNSTPVIGEITDIENGNGIETTYNVNNKYYESKLVKKEIAEIGDKKYFSLAEAINDSKENDNIKLISNGSEFDNLSINKNITIDLNNNTIDFRNRITIESNIKISIIDSSNEKNGTINLYPTGTSTEYIKSIENNGNLQLENVSIYNYGEYSYQLYNSENSTCNINNSNIIGKIKNTYQIYNKSTNENDINNSKISREFIHDDVGSNNYMIYNLKDCSLNLNDDEILVQDLSSGDKFGYITAIYNDGKMKINNVKNYSNYTNNEWSISIYQGIVNDKNGKLNCKMVTFENQIVNWGNAIIKNCNISDTIKNYLDMTIEESEIKNKSSDHYHNSGIYTTGNLKMISGSISGFDYGISNFPQGELYIGIKGGEIQSESPKISGISYGIGYDYNDTGNVYFYDGTISGKEAAIKGEFKEIEPNYQIYTSVDSDGYTNVSLTPIGGTVNVASIGSVNYTSLQDAIASCTTGGESIVLTRDIELDTSTINIDGSKNITINLNGHKITSTSSESALTNNGTLTIKDTSSTMIGNITNSNGTSIINNGTLNIGINNEDGILNTPTIEGKDIGIQNTTLKGILNLYNGKIIGQKAVDGNPINELKTGYIITKNIEDTKEVVSLIKQ